LEATEGKGEYALGSVVNAVTLRQKRPMDDEVRGGIPEKWKLEPKARDFIKYMAVYTLKDAIERQFSRL